jgi:hypothetical protein
MEIYGADFSWARPDAGSLKSAGYSFVLGYISRTGSKCLANWRGYADAGLGVGFFFEDDADQARRGHQQGSADGAFVEQWLRANGVPTSVPVLAAADYDAPGGDFPAIAEYMAGFNLATNNPVGIYGKFSLVEAMVTPGVQPTQFGCQTAAWSQGRLSQKANLYQRATHHHPCPSGSSLGDFDEEVLCRAFPFAGVAVAAPA